METPDEHGKREWTFGLEMVFLELFHCCRHASFEKIDLFNVGVVSQVSDMQGKEGHAVPMRGHTHGLRGPASGSAHKEASNMGVLK